MFGNHSSSTPEAPVSPTTASAPTGTDSKQGSHGKASQLLASAKSSLSSIGSTLSGHKDGKEPKKEERSFKVHHPPEEHFEVSKSNPLNNSAGDSQPGPNSTFRVGVTEDRNRKCRRTMEDTHSFIYNFLSTPIGSDAANTSSSTVASEESHAGKNRTETDNGYFAIFDGHAGAYAADWCGKRLHIVLEETIRKFPDTPIPELLDATFTNCDSQLEKLPMRNSGCTAVCAVLRWEDRPVSSPVSSGSAEAARSPPQATTTERKRVLYTANVGDARIVLCRGGKAMRLSYDHKGSDEHESKRVSNAGGLILNNRVNGVLAVTRALGDSYMKELVTGHPYTTETVLQPDDEFFILACDGLWDVCSDQEAVDLVRDVDNPQDGSKILVDHALQRFSSDNLSAMIVRLDHNKSTEKSVQQTQPQSQKAVSVKDAANAESESASIKKEQTASDPKSEITDAPAATASETTDTKDSNAPTVVDMALR